MAYINFILSEHGVIIPDNIKPLFLRLQRTLSEAQRKIITASINVTRSNQTTAIDLITAVAKAADLKSNQHAHASMLGQTVNCSKYFAMKVLKAIESGDERSMYTCADRSDTIVGTEWPKKNS